MEKKQHGLTAKQQDRKRFAFGGEVFMHAECMSPCLGLFSVAVVERSEDKRSRISEMGMDLRSTEICGKPIRFDCVAGDALRPVGLAGSVNSTVCAAFYGFHSVPLAIHATISRLKAARAGRVDGFH